MEHSHPMFELLRGLGRPFANVVQVGANLGQEITAFERYGLEWAIMIEPLDEAFGKLCKRAEERPRYIPVQALCSSLDGVRHEFFVASNKGQSSSFLKPTRHKLEYPKIEFPNTIQLVSTTLDAVLARVLKDHPELALDQLDSLMIDVQGAELKVLMGAAVLLQHTRYVFTEVSYDLYEGGATLDDLQGFLRGFGFQLQHLEMNRHGWGDALFIKLAG